MAPRPALPSAWASRTNFSKELSALLREPYGSDIKVFQSEIPHSVRAKERGILTPAIGFGGGCLPKDLQGLTHFARDMRTPLSQPTIREIYEHYKPMVKERALADEAYQNACKNSDQPTARLEGDAAVKRAAAAIMGPDFTMAQDFMRLYFDTRVCGKSGCPCPRQIQRAPRPAY